MRMADQGVMQARAKPLTYPCSVRDFLPEDPELCLVDLKDAGKDVGAGLEIRDLPCCLLVEEHNSES